MDPSETPRASRRVGDLSAEDRLARIEQDIDKLDGKIDLVLAGMSEGSTRFRALEMTCASLSDRIAKLEDGRDAVVKVIVIAVLVAMLGLVGLKVTG